MNVSKKYTYNEVKEYIESFGYKLLSEEYTNNSTPLKIKCPLGHVTDTLTFGRFKHGTRCKTCAKNVKFNYEYVKTYVESFGYSLLSKEYKNNHSKISLLCPLGHNWEVLFLNFKNYNRRCKYCNGNAKFTYEEIKKYIESFGYKLLSTEYENSRTKLLIECSKGHVYEATFDTYKNKECRCPECRKNIMSEKMKPSFNEVKEYIENEGYKLLSNKYDGSHEKLLIMCSNKHQPYDATFSNFKQGRRCPYCNESKGEKEISKILEKYNIKYNQQYKFDECKFKKHLLFDFYLPDYNCCIEYDGQQHFEIIECFGGFDGFIDTKIRDTIKNEYCKKNDIELIRIPYWDYDRVEEILKKELELK